MWQEPGASPSKDCKVCSLKKTCASKSRFEVRYQHAPRVLIQRGVSQARKCLNGCIKYATHFTSRQEPQSSFTMPELLRFSPHICFIIRYFRWLMYWVLKVLRTVRYLQSIFSTAVFMITHSLRWHKTANHRFQVNLILILLHILFSFMSRKEESCWMWRFAIFNHQMLLRWSDQGT